MSRVLPILFNTDMVRAILDGRKTVTRRIAKKIPDRTHRIDKIQELDGGDIEFECHYGGYLPAINAFCDSARTVEPPYQPEDILYVREAFCESQNQYFYKADNRCSGCTEDGTCLPRGIDKHITCKACENESGYLKWKPSIHMPKEAARIWLRVTDVRVERLQDMPHDGALKEGIHFCECPDGFTWKPTTDMRNCYTSPNGAMRALWNSTVPKKDLDRHGWDANPWVFVIEFERCEKTEGMV